MDSVAWTDRYARVDGRVFLTGMQAIIRLLIDKQRHDGLHAEAVNQTFVTGYEGSPLGGLDLEVVDHLDTLNQLGRTIHQFGINEKTAISAILGSQYAPSGDVDALADRIANLLSDPVLMKKFGQEGRFFFESRFTVNAMVRNYISIYKVLVQFNR